MQQYSRLTSHGYHRWLYSSWNGRLETGEHTIVGAGANRPPVAQLASRQPLQLFSALKRAWPPSAQPPDEVMYRSQFIGDARHLYLYVLAWYRLSSVQIVGWTPIRQTVLKSLNFAAYRSVYE